MQDSSNSQESQTVSTRHVHGALVKCQCSWGKPGMLVRTILAAPSRYRCAMDRTPERRQVPSRAHPHLCSRPLDSRRRHPGAARHWRVREGFRAPLADHTPGVRDYRVGCRKPSTPRGSTTSGTTGSRARAILTRVDRARAGRAARARIAEPLNFSPTYTEGFSRKIRQSFQSATCGNVRSGIARCNPLWPQRFRRCRGFNGCKKRAKRKIGLRQTKVTPHCNQKCSESLRRPILHKERGPFKQLLRSQRPTSRGGLW
jgi:hypothetical protein